MVTEIGRPAGRRAAIVVSVVCAVLYLVVGGRFLVFGSMPAYLFVLTATVAFIEGEGPGCVAGFLAGMVADLLGAGPVGLSALLMCVAGYLLGFRRRDYLAEGWGRPLLYFILADVAYTVVYLLIALFMGSVEMSAGSIAAAVVAGVVSDALVAAIAFIIVSGYLDRRSTRMSGLFIP